MSKHECHEQSLMLELMELKLVNSELLETLKDLLAMRDKCMIPNADGWWDDKANKAIAKAEGK